MKKTNKFYKKIKSKEGKKRIKAIKIKKMIMRVNKLNIII